MTSADFGSDYPFNAGDRFALVSVRHHHRRSREAGGAWEEQSTRLVAEPVSEAFPEVAFRRVKEIMLTRLEPYPGLTD